jgi:hypothetical protein
MIPSIKCLKCHLTGQERIGHINSSWTKKKSTAKVTHNICLFSASFPSRWPSPFFSPDFLVSGTHALKWYLIRTRVPSQKLYSLASPFRAVSYFHLGSWKSICLRNTRLSPTITPRLSLPGRPITNNPFIKLESCLTQYLITCQ